MKKEMTVCDHCGITIHDELRENTPKFVLGSIVSTPGALELKEEGLDLFALLKRHAQGDWGDLCKEDKAENEFSLRNGFRLFSSYDTEFGKLWIITEADRSVTTFLLPSEY